MSAGEITVILQRIQCGEESAAERLLPLVYEDLRRMAAGKMSREPAGLTLQATALVHEAWLRLGGDQQPDWKSRAHFFAAAAEAMRRILVDSARRRKAQRRGGGKERLNIDDVDIPVAEDERVLKVHDALDKLAMEEPEKAELVKLRFFAGLTLEDSAKTLGISDRTARRWWDYARASLLIEMGPAEAQ